MGYIEDKIAIKRLLKKAFLQIDYTGNIDQKIESILVKLANEVTFEEAIEGKKFVNPKTKNKVNFSSLPLEEQKKIRGQFDKNVEEEIGGGEKKDKKESPKQMAKKIQDTLKKDKKLRDKVVKDIKSPETKKKIVDGMKANIKEEDLNKLGDSLKNKDAKSFKQALPGVLKGLAKGLLIGLGVALVVGLSGGMIANAVVGTADDLKQDAIDDLDLEYADEREEALEEYLEEELEGEDEIKECLNDFTGKARSEIFIGLGDGGEFKIDTESYIGENSDEGLYGHVFRQIEEDVLEGKPNIMVYDEETGENISLVTEEEWGEIGDKREAFWDKMKEDGWEEKEVKQLLWENGGEEKARDQEVRVNKMLEVVKNAEQKAYDNMSEDQRKSTDESYEEYFKKREDFMEIDPGMQMRSELIKISEQEMDKIDFEAKGLSEDQERLSKEIGHQKEIQDFANKDKEKIEAKQQEWEKEKIEKEDQLKKLKDQVDGYEKVNKDIEETKKEFDTTKNTISTNENRLREISKRSVELEKKMTSKVSPEIHQKLEEELSRLQDEQSKIEDDNEKLEKELKKNKGYLKEVENDRKELWEKLRIDLYDIDKHSRITTSKESINVAKEYIKSLGEDISYLDGDIERSKEKVKGYEDEQKEIVKNKENLIKQKSDIESFRKDLSGKGTSIEDSQEEEYNKKALKRATMNKFSKANEMNLELLAEKLQEKLSTEVSNLGEKKKLVVKDKPKKPKTNKKARDSDFEIKFI